MGVYLRQLNNYIDASKLECTTLFQDFNATFFSKCEDLWV